MNEKLTELLETWKGDSEIDLTNPGRALLDIPKLHSKYLDILSSYREGLRKLEVDLKRLRKVKWEYYMGRLDEETLRSNNWEAFPYVLIKSDVGIYLDGDSDLGRYYNRKAFYEEMIECCISIMKELNSRTYQLKAYIDYEKFIGGV